MRHTFIQRLLLILLFSSSLQGRAAEWSLEPGISLRTGLNDNIRMTTQDHDTVWESALSPAVKFGVKTEISGLTGDAGLAIRRFVGGSGRESSSVLDRQDYHLNTNAYHNTPLGSLKADLDYTRDSTLDSELDQTGHVSDERATRERLALGPSWSRFVTELTRLDLAYHYTIVDYTNDPGISDLVGYSYQVASASLIHQFTPRLQGTLATGYSSYRPDTDLNSDTLTLQAGLSRNFSETLVASLLFGQRLTTSDSFYDTGFCVGALPGATFPSCTGGTPVPVRADTQVENTSAVYTASVTKTLETGSLSAALSRSSSPSSNGELLDATRLVLSGNYNLSETLHTSLRIQYIENDTLVSQAGFMPGQGTETFFRVTPKVGWRWRRDWELAGEYQYVNNEDPGRGTATRNAFYITLNYQLPKRSVSR